MDKQRLLELAGITESSDQEFKRVLGVFMRYASDNWEGDVWQDAAVQLLNQLHSANPSAAMDFVKGNLGADDDEEMYADYMKQYGEPADQSGLPIGNQRDWK